MDDLTWRTKNVLELFTRYGTAVESNEMVDVLEAVEDINDDMAHGRSIECIDESISEAKLALDALLEACKHG